MQNFRTVKAKLKMIARPAAFCAVFFVLLMALQFVLQDKWHDNHYSYTRVRLFYDEEPAPDVVFVGSSSIFCGISPLSLYESYGICSYDFAPPSQSMEVTELYVREAIDTFKPAVIVLEADRLFHFPVNEQRARWWLDPVPLSSQKMKTIRALYEENEKYDLGYELGGKVSWAFPLLRYHERWKELREYDFSMIQNDPYYHGQTHYHGYRPNYTMSSVTFSGYMDAVSFENGEITEGKRCFDGIVELCAREGVELVIMRAPSNDWRQAYHDLIGQWADEYGIPFVDYNEANGPSEELGLNMETDFIDQYHLNDAGAAKVSEAMGAFLSEHFSLPDRRGDSDYAGWEDDLQVYRRDRASWYLSHDTNWTSYLQKLQDPNYTVCLVAKDDLGGETHPELTGQLKTLGLTQITDNAAHMKYAAVIEGENVLYECLSNEPLSYETVVNGHHIQLDSQNSQENRTGIRLDWLERFVDHRGVGIVVYDNVLEDVVDRVTFDLADGGKAYR